MEQYDDNDQPGEGEYLDLNSGPAHGTIRSVLLGIALWFIIWLIYLAIKNFPDTQ